MMFPNVDSRETGSVGGDGSRNGQLLHDIEALGKALSLTKARSKSAGRTRISEERPYSLKEDVSSGGSDLMLKGKKSSMWNWKKPLKALTHIRDRKFNCCFYVHVRSIEGLPSYFNNLGLCVQWKRKDAVWKTRPSRVESGFADFRQTFKHQCSVYGHRSGHHHSSKYESILFLLYVSVVGAPGVDIGKHWVDITNVLPLTLEELEDPKSSGKWTTSFKLSGKAKGATLNISIGYSVMGNGSIGSKRFTDALFSSHSDDDRPNKIERVSVPSVQEEHVSLSSGGSVPSDVSLVPHRSSQYIDAEVSFDNLPNADLQFSRSIQFLYKIIDEVKLGTSEKVDSLTESAVPPHTQHDSASVSAEANNENELDDLEFSVIEQGIEIITKEQPRSEENIDLISGGHDLETLDERVEVNDAFSNKGMEDSSNGDVYDNLLDGLVIDESIYKEQHASTRKELADELQHNLGDLLLPESVDSMGGMSKFLDLDNDTKVKSYYNAPRMERSRSLDDLTESVANDFLHMLETETASYHLSSDSDPGSPRECLLRQFEEEALASGSFLYDDDLKEEIAEAVSAAPALTVVGDVSDEFEFSAISEIPERKQKKENASLICKRKAKLLESMETEALMDQWGLNEMAFVNSPRTSSGGFGSPIYRPNEEPVELPPLAEGLGPVLPTETGGYLRSMNPKIFRNAKSSGSLIMQVSRPVVLPAEMGSDIMDILKQFAAYGIDKFSFQANRLMPLDDISQKTMQDLTRHAADLSEASQRMEFSEDEPLNKQLRDDRRGGLEYLNNKTDEMSLSLRGDEVGLECTSAENLTFLAMSEIEALLIEGLRIQSGMSGEEAPAYEMAYVNSGESFRFGGTFENKQQSFVGDHLCNSDGLMHFCLPLDEWLKLDAGLISDEHHIDKHILEVLAAHHAKCTELIRGSFSGDATWLKSPVAKCGLLGDKFTEAVRIQLRDPFRNYEPVGIPILALVQVERVYFSLKSDLYDTFNDDEKDENSCEVIKEIKEDEDEDGVQGTSFRIIEVHVAGLNAESHKKRHWGSTTQQQSGCRWLLSHGMNKAMIGSLSKSKAIVKSTPHASRRMSYGDTLWSISSNVSRSEVKWEVSSASNSAMRNPDVIFQEELIASR